MTYITMAIADAPHATVSCHRRRAEAGRESQHSAASRRPPGWKASTHSPSPVPSLLYEEEKDRQIDGCMDRATGMRERKEEGEKGRSREIDKEREREREREREIDR